MVHSDCTIFVFHLHNMNKIVPLGIYLLISLTYISPAWWALWIDLSFVKSCCLQKGKCLYTPRVCTAESWKRWIPYFSKKKRNLFNVFAFACARSCCYAWAFSSCGPHESPCGGFYSCIRRALWARASVVVAPGLSCSVAEGLFPDQGLNPCSLQWQADS